MKSVASPCIGTCLLDPDIPECIGCYRTIKEIQNWNKYSNEEKTKVLIRVQKRGKGNGRQKI